MLFHITQTHTPDLCPRDKGGSTTLYDAGAEGAQLRAIFGSFAEHEIFYIVEAESVQAVNRFLLPGFTRCACRITPVSEEPIAS